MSYQFRTYNDSQQTIVDVKMANYLKVKNLKSFHFHSCSYKKINPINIKIFNRLKTNDRIQGRNDRMDLFLEGQPFSQMKIHGGNALKINHFHHRNKIKTFSFLKSDKKMKSRNGSSLMYTSNQMRTEKVLIRSKIQKKQQMQEIEVNLKSIKKQEKEEQEQEQEKKSIRKIEFSRRQKKLQNRKNWSYLIKNQSVRNSLKSTDNEENGRNKQRPLFYLQAKQVMSIRADSYIVTEFPSGQIIFGNYYKKIGEIASLTKIMTFYAVCQICEQERIDLTSELIEIDQDAESMTGTSAEVTFGDIYTIEQLLYGLMLPSGNDAAIALAKWGGIKLKSNIQENANYVNVFVEFMNTLAKRLKMNSTKFGNPHGLPHPQSGSNPQDVAILIGECLKNTLFRTVVKTKQYRCSIIHDGIRQQIYWENTNKLLRRPNFIGVKTGVTITAGPCLSTCYEIDNKILIVVLLRTNKLSRRFKQTRQILALALSKLNKKKYQCQIAAVLKNNIELDSDNSEDEEEFNYERNDLKQLSKRKKILRCEM